MDVQDGQHRVLVEFPHERVDTYKTTFGNECFTESFAARLPVMCWQHDLRDPIGHAEKAQVLRHANELTGIFSDFAKVPNAGRAHSQIEDGTLTDFSFGFRDPQYENHPEHRGVRRIRKAMMKEFSPVTIGSIPGAVATGIREDQVMAERSVKEVLELRDAGLLSEEDAMEAIRALVDPELAQKVRIITPAKTEPVRGPDGAIVENTDGSTRDDDIDLPEVVNAASILAALPEPYQRAIQENGARVFLVVGDEEWGPVSQVRALDDGLVSLAVQVDAAIRSGIEWLGDIDMAEQPEAFRQSVALFQAAGTASDTMLDIADPDGTLRANAENMASEPVKCSLCGGSGKTEDGKICPRCEGSGVEAEERSEELRAPYWEQELFLRFVSADDRKKMADEGVAMGNGDFPIPDKGHLSSALGHFSGYTGDKKAAKAHIQKRAKALGVDLSKGDFDGEDRADMPEGSEECPKCDGEGKLPAPKDGGHRLTCPDCHGKGYMARAEPDDDDDSEDDMADESGDGKPSGEGAAASEDEDETEKQRQDTLRLLDRRVGV
jgi:HK97 family phage prohead protease